MKMIPSKMLSFLLFIMICAGCSVKEDRGDCPCRLVLDFSETDTSAVKSADLRVTADDGFIFTDEQAAEDYWPEVCLMVPRREVAVGVWSGTEGRLGEDGLSIPLGEDCPPVFFHTSVVDADYESQSEKVVMRKNHCRMTVTLKNIEYSLLGIIVSGKVDGYCSDGEPSEGEFRYVLDLEGSRANEVILPRQLDNSLMLEVSDESGVSKIFAVGEYIAGIGYDWTEPDLKDLELDIDIAFTRITITIRGWDTSYDFEVVI